MTQYLAIAAAFLVACTVPVDGCFEDDGEPSACQMLDWHLEAEYHCEDELPATETDHYEDYVFYYQCLAGFFAAQGFQFYNENDYLDYIDDFLNSYQVPEGYGQTCADEGYGFHCLFDVCKNEADKCGLTDARIAEIGAALSS